MKIVGIVRYAIPNAFSGIKTVRERDGVLGVKSRDVIKLYEDPYFTDRFNVFYNITLESFKNQTNKDFILCIYHTDQIPEDKKRLFDKIEKEYPFVRCVYVPDDKMPIPEDLKEQNMLTFRIDNDDGVPVDFIDRLKNTIDSTDEINFAITIPKIRKIMRVGEDEYKTVTANYPSNSMGEAYYTNKNKTIMDLGNHTNIHKRFKTKILNGNGGLQIINSYNVANKFEKKNNYKDKTILKTEQIKELLEKEKYYIGDLSCLPICKGETNGQSVSNNSSIQHRKVPRKMFKFHY